MLGTRLNPLVVSWLGLRRTTIVLLLGEGFGLAALGLWIAGQAVPVPALGGAVGIIVLAGITTFMGGVNGPSWVTVVARWGGNPVGRQRRLLADSAAFQVAAAVGPLAGSLVVASASLLWVLPFMNIAMNAAVAAVVGWGTRRYPLAAPTSSDGEEHSEVKSALAPGDEERGRSRGELLRSIRVLPPLALLILAAFADPLRTVLPFLVREAGGAAVTLAATTAALAVAAALATVLALDRAWTIRLTGWMNSGGTFVALGAGALLWLKGADTMFFVVGALLLGIASATLYGQLMTAATHADQAEGRETRYVADAILLRALLSSLVAFMLASAWGDSARTATTLGAAVVCVIGLCSIGWTIRRRAVA